MRKLIIVALLALLVASFQAYATNTNSALAISGLPPITLSVDGTSAVVDELDDSGGSKGGAIVACVVSGQAVNIYVRFQVATNGTFVDLVVSDTVTNLDTAVGAMNLSARSHPAPTEDAFDTAILAAAAAD